MNGMESVCSQAKRSLADWFETPGGQRLLLQENRLLQGILPDLFGYHLLTLGGLPYDLSASPIAARHAAYSPEEPHLNSDSGFLCAQTDLPIQRDSVDVLFLPHIIEYSRYPHIVLREAERVLHSDGYIIILGFNPVSYYGICRAILAFRQVMPWQGYFYHSARIRDWLQLLGLGIHVIRFIAFTPPVASESIASRITFLERCQHGFLAPFGGVYMIVARNMAVTPTVIRPRWHRKEKPLLEGRAVEPTAGMRKKYE